MLGIVIATYNRRAGLRAALDSVERTTQTPHAVVVVDGGSTDGTLDLLRERGVTTIAQGRLQGVARACNAGFARLETDFICWLSDDTEVLPGALDLAVSILQREPMIGMVGLKMREASRPEKGYAGGVSEAGILNCNHGVLPLSLLRELGGFHEGYRSYMVDPDLTASVLATGRRVVMTRHHAVLHHRDPSVLETERALLESPEDPARTLYRERFGWIGETQRSRADRALRPAVSFAVRLTLAGLGADQRRLGLGRRDDDILERARWVSPFDPLVTARRPYHLVQQLPHRIVIDPRTPVRVRGS